MPETEIGHDTLLQKARHDRSVFFSTFFSKSPTLNDSSPLWQFYFMSFTLSVLQPLTFGMIIPCRRRKIFRPVKKPRWPTHYLWTLWENRADTSWRLKPSWYQAPEGFSGSNMPGAFVFWVPGFQLRPSFSWRTQYVVKAHEVWKIWRTQYVIQALKGLKP